MRVCVVFKFNALPLTSLGANGFSYIVDIFACDLTQVLPIRVKQKSGSMKKNLNAKVAINLRQCKDDMDVKDYPLVH